MSRRKSWPFAETPYRRAESSRSVLLFSDEVLWPTSTGMQQRALEILRALESLGGAVIVVHHGSPLASTAVPLVGARTRLVRISGGLVDNLVSRVLYWWHRLRRTEPSFDSLMRVPVTVRLRVRRLCHRAGIDTIVVSHARNAGAVLWLGRHGPHRVLDLPDLLSLNLAYVDRLTGLFGSAPWDFDSLNAERYRASLNPDPLLRPDSDEIAACAVFDEVFAVAHQEAAIVQRSLRAGVARWVPMAVPPGPLTVPADDGRTLLLVCSSSVFNLHAYAWLVRDVLPLLRGTGAEFELRVIGAGSLALPATSNVALLGRVDDLAEAYRTATVVLCPTRVGTGQSVKAAEAMAHGCAVVMTEFAAERLVVDRGATCLVADDASEFAAAIRLLLAEPEYRLRMGEAARAAAETVYLNSPARAAFC